MKKSDYSKLLEQDCLSGLWNFIERFHPNYYHSQEVAENDRLTRYLNDEGFDDDESQREMIEEYPTKDVAFKALRDNYKSLLLECFRHIEKMSDEELKKELLK